MRRHPGLRLLSEEHYFALAQARDLRQVGREDAQLSYREIVERFLEFWDQGGHEHFRKEEELLLPLYSQYAPVNTVEMLNLFIQHTQIRQQVLQLRTAVQAGQELSLDQLHRLGQEFESHIRHEERVVFPLIEATVPDAVLSTFENYTLS